MPALDGLRAISVAMVFAIHAFPDAPFPGGLGVDVFFVISGFLITRILLREVRAEGTINLKAFYIQRALRLYPPLVLVCAVFLIAFAVIRRGMPWAELGYTGLALTYVSNIWMTVTGSYMGHLTHTWSLAQEEQFYLLWPALLLLFTKRGASKRKIILVVAVLAAASLAGWVIVGSHQPYNPLNKAGGLLAGCLTAFLADQKRWESGRLACAAVFVFVAAFALETAHLLPREVTLLAVSFTLPFLILHLAFGRSPLVSALSSKVLVHVGTISYGLYLWHYPILSALHSLRLNGVLGAIIAAVLSYLAALVSFRLVESPALRLKDRIRAKREATLLEPAGPSAQ